MTKKVYIAGPDVFSLGVTGIRSKKLKLCEEYGYEGLFPADMRSSKETFSSNIQLIKKADFGIFDLTPFRGISCDVGTAFELGIMYALNKPIFGYTYNTIDYLNRVKSSDGYVYLNRVLKKWIDPNNMVIEDYDNVDNLMIDEAFKEKGVKILRLKNYYEDGFEICLELSEGIFDP